jgi:hypothetical protein
MSTSVIHRISVNPEAGALSPEVNPVAGSNYAAADLQALGWVTIGSKDNGDDCDLDSETVSQVPNFEGAEVKAPGALNRSKTIVRHNGIDEITWIAYDVSEAIAELSSTAGDLGGGSIHESAEVTYRSVLIEIDGIRADYYPRVLLRISDESGGFGPGDDAATKTEFTAIVHSYSADQGDLAVDIPSGRIKGYYASAT